MVPESAAQQQERNFRQTGKHRQSDQNAAREQQRLRRAEDLLLKFHSDRFSELARVTIMPPEIEIISAGITVTSPSPIVRTV